MLQGKRALITGCSRGIGKSTLDLFARNGAHVFASFRAYDEKYENYCKNLSEQYQVEVKPLYFEMENYDQIKSSLKTVFEQKCNVDILVNNAGVTSNALFNMTSMSYLKQIFETNFFAHLYITQIVAKLMMKQRAGSIVNVASIIGIDGNAGQVAYGASKAALIGATKSLAKELVSYGIRVNAVAPGFTETDMLTNVPAEVYDNCVHSVGMKRSGRPEEIANTILFLASDKASYITGQVIRVDGGL